MRGDVKDRWLTALESGEYAQTNGVLARVNADGSVWYCCLGVLCDVIKDDAGLEVRLDQVGAINRFSFNFEALVLPLVAQRFAGLNFDVPDYNFEAVPDAQSWDYDKGTPIAPFDKRGNSVELHLASLNDEGFTFAQIADIIRWIEPAE